MRNQKLPKPGDEIYVIPPSFLSRDCLKWHRGNLNRLPQIKNFVDKVGEGWITVRGEYEIFWEWFLSFEEAKQGLAELMEKLRNELALESEILNTLEDNLNLTKYVINSNVVYLSDSRKRVKNVGTLKPGDKVYVVPNGIVSSDFMGWSRINEMSEMKLLSMMTKKIDAVGSNYIKATDTGFYQDGQFFNSFEEARQEMIKQIEALYDAFPEHRPKLELLRANLESTKGL